MSTSPSPIRPQSASATTAAPALRLARAGKLLLVFAQVFLLAMLALAGAATDPVALMGTVGTVWGTLSGLGIALILIERRAPRGR